MFYQIIASLIGFAIIGTISVFAWFEHIFACIAVENWGFMIAGAIFFPIAVVHGIGIWFGIW